MTLQASLPDTVQFDLAPQGGGAPYRIYLYTPPGEPPAGGWPVLYLLDGNAVIATAVDVVRVQAPYPLGTGVGFGVIVAIGYPTDGPYDSVRRSWDMGPPPGATYPPHTETGPQVRTGGADAFLAFIGDDLKPEIARRVPVDARRQAIFGHSFGGLFVLHALFRAPDAFTAWISASPAIWWEGAGIITQADAFIAGRQGGGGQLLLLVGEYEQQLAPFQIGAADAQTRLASFAESRIVDNTREMAERLAAVPGLATAYELLRCETHMSVLPASINHAVRCAFGTAPAA
ncbi:alpha/beta hydrolase-fold protein [Azorhizobium sp. AG788]|uniref:alpha/beta hydrolase n=1 Tax=Azorhizobium sp. AG788 TaxID=2183897 RepID=UPI003139A366